MMKKLFETLRSRKGITMTEVIVAMAMVLIVSGAAISLLVASVQFDAKYNSQTQALNACESAVEAIRFAGNESDLNGYLARLGFEIKAGESHYALPGNDTVKIQVDGNKWTVIFEGKEIYAKELPDS